MRVLMCTNTYLPHVGGVAKSVDAFARNLQRLGHEVLIVAPEFEGRPESEPHVLRVPALQSVNAGDFPLPVLMPGMLGTRLDQFDPQIVHSHHPFFLGSTALRIAAARDLPIVFTHHTRYESYTHYLPVDAPVVGRFVAELAARYGNLCDSVVAPSRSMARALKAQGVETSIHVIPTGVEPGEFAQASGAAARQRHGIPPGAPVVGHVGRLAPEKNLVFLTEAVARYMRARPRSRFLVVGDGPSADELREVCQREGVADRLHLTGILEGRPLVDAYAAMDVFVFSSQSETQGMVMAEAMAAGVPVVALDGSGVRDVLQDMVNGRLLRDADPERFARAIDWVMRRQGKLQETMRSAARATAARLSMQRCAQRLVRVYRTLLTQRAPRAEGSSLARWLDEEWRILSNVAGALTTAIRAT